MDPIGSAGAMIPLLFGTTGRRLLGMYSPAAPPAKRRGVVLCPPFGQEYIRSHRTCRILATRLSDVGHDVLRFDYYGTGNSAGDDRDVSLSGAVEDTLLGVEEVCDMAGVRRVTLVGLRTGALVARLAAGNADAVDRLVLWDPVTDARAYVRDSIAEGAPIGPDGDREAQGFVFARRFQEELSSIEATEPAAAPSEVLVAVCRDGPEHAHLVESLTASGSDVEYAVFDDPPSWTETENLGVGAVPVNLLKRIVEW